MTFEPEIVEGDELHELIVTLVNAHRPKTILEIGSANGMGSTQAFINGILAAGIDEECKLFCMEAHPERFAELVENTKAHKFVFPIHACSVSLGEYMNEAAVRFFMREHGYRFNIKRHSVDRVLSWLKDELRMIEENHVSQRGIERVKRIHKLRTFDMVLIDGSAFTGWFDFYHTLGSKVFILDDTLDIKCHAVVKAFLADPGHKMTHENKEYRNGYAVFERED